MRAPTTEDVIAEMAFLLAAEKEKSRALREKLDRVLDVKRVAIARAMDLEKQVTELKSKLASADSRQTLEQWLTAIIDHPLVRRSKQIDERV
jgi:hypothetical protein